MVHEFMIMKLPLTPIQLANYLPTIVNSKSHGHMYIKEIDVKTNNSLFCETCLWLFELHS